MPDARSGSSRLLVYFLSGPPECVRTLLRAEAPPHVRDHRLDGNRLCAHATVIIGGYLEPGMKDTAQQLHDGSLNESQHCSQHSRAKEWQVSMGGPNRVEPNLTDRISPHGNRTKICSFPKRVTGDALVQSFHCDDQSSSRSVWEQQRPCIADHGCVQHLFSHICAMFVSEMLRPGMQVLTRRSRLLSPLSRWRACALIFVRRCYYPAVRMHCARRHLSNLSVQHSL